MFKILLKHIIYEACIDQFFKGIGLNLFNTAHNGIVYNKVYKKIIFSGFFITSEYGPDPYKQIFHNAYIVHSFYREPYHWENILGLVYDEANNGEVFVFAEAYTTYRVRHYNNSVDHWEPTNDVLFKYKIYKESDYVVPSTRKLSDLIYFGK